MQDQLQEELIPFLQNDSRIELKLIAAQHILSEYQSTTISAEIKNFFNFVEGLTGTTEGVEIIISNLELLKTLVTLTTDSVYPTAKDACFGENKISCQLD